MELAVGVNDRRGWVFSHTQRAGLVICRSETIGRLAGSVGLGSGNAKHLLRDSVDGRIHPGHHLNVSGTADHADRRPWHDVLIVVGREGYSNGIVL